MSRRHVLAAGCVALLAACAGAPPAPPSAEPVAPYRASAELAGRLTVHYQKDGQSASLTGAFAWRQSAARTDISLSSPLGQTVAAISVTPQAATLTEPGRPPRVAPDIDSLSAQALGWPLPVSGLRDWLQGYAVRADGSRFAASARDDRVTTRDGWHLRFVSWQAQPGRAPQPKRIDAERGADSQSDPVALRIVIDQPAAP